MKTLSITLNTEHGRLTFAVPVDSIPARLRERLFSWLRGEISRRMMNMKKIGGSEND